MGRMIEAFRPDYILQFSPDHFHAFHYDNLPSFCVGVATESYGDYGTATGPLNVNEGFALELLDALRASDIDAAVSFAMKVDHGFIQMWETMFGGFAGLPIIPVFVNAVGYPLPTYRRARLLGEAARRFARHSGKRILFAASGGLSHDPVVPRIRGADEALRNRLIGRPPLTRAQQAEREKLVKTAGEAARNGAGPLPVAQPGLGPALPQASAHAGLGGAGCPVRGGRRCRGGQRRKRGPVLGRRGGRTFGIRRHDRGHSGGLSGGSRLDSGIGPFYRGRAGSWRRHRAGRPKPRGAAGNMTA
jgi:hypothetical protein